MESILVATAIFLLAASVFLGAMYVHEPLTRIAKALEELTKTTQPSDMYRTQRK